MRNRTFEESIDAYKNPTEDVYLRRLFRILSTPTKASELVFKDERCSDEANWCKVCKGNQREYIEDERSE